MKICVIHGSPRKGNTYKATKILMKKLQNFEEIEFTEFYLPKDMPHFCCGCYTCFDKTEEKCPHASYAQPIAKAIKEADGLIFTSPVYVLAESGAMKVLLDHFGYMYLPHRPMEELFSKVAMVISTTAGAGTKDAIKTIARNLSFWGVKRIYKCGFSLYALNWEDMKKDKQVKFENILDKKAKLFYSALKKREKLSTRIFTRIVFMAIRKMIKGYEDGQADKEYWNKKGWLSGKKPF